jgi:hypothetical protein
MVLVLMDQVHLLHKEQHMIILSVKIVTWVEEEVNIALWSTFSLER